MWDYNRSGNQTFRLPLRITEKGEGAMVGVIDRKNHFYQHQRALQRRIIILLSFMSWHQIVSIRGLYHAWKGPPIFRFASSDDTVRSQIDVCHWNSHTNHVECSEYKETTQQKYDQVTNEAHIQKWLVVGDGDLSYSANLAMSLQQQRQSTTGRNGNNSNIQLIASVLESADTHARVYRYSNVNIQSLIETTNRHPKFEIDATTLEKHFEPNSLHRIIFNFPHWIGKSNNRYNRKLLYDFFESACRVLVQHSDSSGCLDSEIHVTLCHRQGGADANTLSEWKQSWMAHSIAAEHGLLLRRLQPFKIDYNLSSHRGVDRPFHVGEFPLTYVFGWPIKGKPISEMLQIAYRFELRILLIPETLPRAEFTSDQIRYGDIIPNLARELLPDGIVCQLPMRSLIPPATHSTDQRWPLLVFLVVYSGEQVPVSRECANIHRIRLEGAVEERLGYGTLLRKGDRMVSNPFPYHLLSKLIDERSI